MWGIKEVMAGLCILEWQWLEATGENFPVGFQPEEVGLSQGDGYLFPASAVLLLTSVERRKELLQKE